MKHPWISFPFLCFFFLIGIPFKSIWAQEKDVTLEAIWLHYQFVPQPTRKLHWDRNAKYIYELHSKKIIVKKDLDKDQVVDTLFHAERYGLPFAIEDYRISPDGEKILLFTSTVPIYRHSREYKCFLYNRSLDTLFAIKDTMYVRELTFSPDSRWIAFVFQRNLYVQATDGMIVVQITTDGEANAIINGHTDWVYEEEFGFTQAYEWSPSSRYLAYLRFDETRVPEFQMMLYDSLYPRPYRFKYPKAGEPNAMVSIHLFDLQNMVSISVPFQDSDFYIPALKWHPEEDRLFFFHLNRLQNQLTVFEYVPERNVLSPFLKETSSTYIEMSDPIWHFLPGKKGFLWVSERDGYFHLYHYDDRGRLVRQVTRGQWEVSKVVAYDPKKQWVYFIGTKKSPLERHFYRVRLDGSRLDQLSVREGTYEVIPSPDQTRFLVTYSDDLLPPVTEIWDQNGRLVKTLQANTDLASTLRQYRISPKRYFQVPVSDSVALNGWMILPHDFDSTRQYPVLLYVYGGPGSQTVQRKYDAFNFFWYQYLASHGYVIVSVDNRGTGGRGRAFRTVTYGRLGEIEVQDQVAVVNHLRTLPFVDPQRIGIWGWSFGGYLTTLCLVKAPHLFKAGIAVAPVTSWRFYDTIYTERYLKTPQLNPSGYDANSPIHYADRLQSRYLLIHGTADDNVHLQNAMMMAEALIQANKQFQCFLYPNKNHGIYGGLTRYHLYRLMSDFIFNNL